MDDLFLKKLKELKLNKDLIVLQDFQDFPVFDEKSALRRRDSIETKINNLTAILEEADGQASAKYILRQINQLDAELQLIESDIQDGRRQAGLMKQKENTIEYVYNQICYLLDNFEILEYKEKNELIRKIVKECIFDDGNLKIIF